MGQITLIAGIVALAAAAVMLVQSVLGFVHPAPHTGRSRATARRATGMTTRCAWEPEVHS